MKVFRALRKVFNSRVNLAIFVFVAVFTFTLSTWLVNFNLIWSLMTSNFINFFDKISILLSLIGSIETNFSLASALSTIIISILFSINISMVVYIYRNRVKTAKGGMFAGVGGFISAVFGIGCASCGAFLLAPALSFIGVGWIISILPFHGNELSFISIAIFIFAIFIFAKRIEDPKICNIS